MQEAYQENLKVYQDNRNVVETAQIEGEAKGRAEGRNERELEIAQNMKKDGVDPNVIAKYTGLSADELERLN